MTRRNSDPYRTVTLLMLIVFFAGVFSGSELLAYGGTLLTFLLFRPGRRRMIAPMRMIGRQARQMGKLPRMPAFSPRFSR